MKLGFVLRNWKAFVVAGMLILSTSVGHSEDLGSERLRMRQEMIRTVRENLPAMLRGFGNRLAEDQISWTEESPRWMAAIRFWMAPENAQKIQNLPFEYISDEEFKVVDITPNRLAINTGDKILFNAKRLSEMPQFNLFDAVQLLLHEFNHLMPEQLELKDWWGRVVETVPWAEAQRDAFATAIMADARKNTKSTTNSRQETTSIMDMGEASQAFRSLSDRLKSMVRERFLIWTESPTQFSLEEEFYKNLHVDEPSVFFKSLSLMHAQWTDSQKMDYKLVPKIEIISLSTNSKQEPVLEAHYYPRFLLEGSKLPLGILQSNVTRTISKGERRFNFRVRQSGDFRLTQQIDRDNSRFLSLQVSGIDGLDVQGALKKVVLMSKGSDGRKFSYQPIRIKKDRSTSNYKMIFQVPADISMEFTEVLIQSQNSDGFPVELSLRPSEVQKVVARGDEKKRPLHRQPRFRNQFDIRFWEGRRQRLIFQLSRVEGLSGVTIESRVPLILSEKNGNRGAYWGRGPIVTAEKKYFSLQELKKYEDPKHPLNFEIPVWYQTYATPAEIAKGARVTLSDSFIRGLTGFWVHFDDGEVIRLELPDEPAIKFQTESKKPFSNGALRCSGVHR